jgi:hypothetical protein
MTAWWLALVGCTSAPPPEGVDRSDSASGGDADTDADADSDTDADADVDEPCPFAGEWVISQATCDEVPTEFVGVPTATVTGTAALCQLQFAATTAATDFSEECTFTERVEMHARSFGFWDTYTDAAGEPVCRDTHEGPRALGIVEVEMRAGQVSLYLYPESREDYFQLTACLAIQEIVLSPGP